MNRNTKALSFQPSELSGVGRGRPLGSPPSADAARRAVAPHRESERGVALILTLAVLTLVTLLVVAFAVSMRVENTASKNYNDLIKARQLAQGAVDQAVATIRSGTPVITNAPVLITYVTSPGAIFTNTGGAWGIIPTFTPITITTNGSIFTTNSIDLNAGNLITGVNASYPLPAPLFVGWSNVVANGELVGRFAYWVDDESTKVNINVAGTRGNDLEGRTPAAIDLRALFSPNDQVNITNFVSYMRPFDTLESIKQVTNNPSYPVPLPNTADFINQADYYTNKFCMTVNSSSPDLTPWGTKRTNVVWVATNTTMTANQKVTAIASALSDANLNTWFGQTFANKYPSTPQIAANILDYISTNIMPTDSSSSPTNLAPPQYLGLKVTPYLNEIDNSNVLAVAANANPALRDISLTVYTQVELWNMYTNDWSAPANTEILLTNVPPVTLVISNVDTGVINTSIVAPSSAPIPVTGTINGPSYTLFPTPARQETFSFTVDTNTITTVIYASNTVTAILRVTSGAVSGRIDYAFLPMAPKPGQITNTVNTLGIITPASADVRLRISEANDPRVKPVSVDWYALVSAGANGTPGSFNSGVLDRQVVTTNNPSVGLRADGDDSCHIISGSRDRGAMYPGELSYIHTGVPWRTFWLQPQFSTETNSPAAIPDWVVLDLFSASDATNVVGRMNINAASTNGNVTLFPDRTMPLFALLTNSLPVNNATVTTSYNCGIAVTNIYYYFQPISRAVVPPATFCPQAFTMVGEVSNTQSLSNTQTIDGSHSKRARETPVRGIANIITTRSDTFTIWATAQSIRDTDKNGLYDPPPAGNDFVTGEVKVQAIVERYESPPGPDGIAGNADDVRFRTRYFRYIYE